MLEQQLQKKVQDYLKLKGIYYFHVPRLKKGNRNQLSGIFDLMCYCKAGHFCIELKKPGDKVKINTNQIEFVKVLHKANIPFLISNDYDEIKGYIDFLEQK